MWITHPEVEARRHVAHEFVPMPLDPVKDAGHVCTGGCYCAECWERKADPPHPRRRRHSVRNEA